MINMTGDVPNLSINNQTLEECINISCCCPFLGGSSDGSVNDCTLPNGQKFQKAYRKELRMMSDEERDRLFKCIRKLKDSGEYDAIALLHREAYDSGGAHGGPAFCLFHRELTKRIELMIRKCDPDLYLPYWDSTLDGRLPQPKDSCLFTDKFLGSTDPSSNYVVDGPFTRWPTTEGKPNISRTVGQMGGCFTDKEIEDVYKQTDIRNVLAYTVPYAGCNVTVNWDWIEYPHGYVHGFIGGDMGDARISANDPCFYFLHCFVDFIFEGWRLRRQNRHQRENDYPPDIAPLQNKDGLRNNYTDYMYEYAPRPNCSYEIPDCGSKYLFCDLSHGTPHCGAKACLGGNCSGFTNGEEACFESVCIDDICVEENVNIKKAKTQSNTKSEEIKETTKPIEAYKTTNSLTNITKTSRETCQTCHCLCTYSETFLIPKRSEGALNIVQK
uniref:Tyrosinase_Cu-bd domain-containing protein n=1 Tax=Meloidogyne hapla TaxID=6305 RepID=A0A1I8BFJ2_MELHA